MYKLKSLSHVGQAMGFYACLYGLVVTGLLTVITLLSDKPIPFTLTPIVPCSITPERNNSFLYRVEAYSSGAVPFFARTMLYPSDDVVTPERHHSSICGMMSYPSDATVMPERRCSALREMALYTSDTTVIPEGRRSTLRGTMLY